MMFSNSHTRIRYLLMRTSPCWTRTCQPHHRVTSRRQVSSRVCFGFSRQPCTETAISLTSGIQMRHSSKHWNRDDDKLLLNLIQAPDDSWIMLCDHEKVLRHLRGPSRAFVSCRALSPSCGRHPQGRPQP